jgi:1-acyl-sn-glycerol-3-phosphate acyltransferase
MHNGAPNSPGRPIPSLLAIGESVVAPLVRIWFRPTLKGLENLPSDRPYVLVANHSGGCGVAELSSLFVLYMQHVGKHRPLAAFAHHVVMRIPGVGWFLRGLGAVPSTYEAAYQTLALGVPLLIFPGGDYEVMRPVWHADRVDFAGRKGFLRIAQQARVPIIPLGIGGSHYTVPILFRARWFSMLLVLPRLAQVKRWPLTLTGLLGVLAIVFGVHAPWFVLLPMCWAWLVSPLMLLPVVPWTVRMNIGKAIECDALFAEGDENLQAAYERVENEVRALATLPRRGGGAVTDH